MYLVMLPRIQNESAAAPQELTTILSSMTPALPRPLTESIAAPFELARAKPKPILITGSLHFAGEALAHLRGEPAAFEECAQ